MVRYTLRQLGYFVAAVERGSVAGAAGVLNVSQPSISAAIAKLEAQLGVQLLLRHHAQGVSATPSGERLLADARSLLQHAEELQQLAGSVGDTVSGELRLGSFSTIAPVFLPALISGFKTGFSDVHITLGEGTQDDLVAGLRAGAVELALLYDFDLPDDLRVTRLAELQPHVLLPKGHRAARTGTVALRDLANEPFILLDVAPSRAYFTGLLKSHGIDPKIAFASPSLELVRGMVGRGLGYSLLITRPDGDRTYEGQRLAVRPIAETVEPGRLAIAALRQLRPTRLMTVFEEYCSEFFSQPAPLSDP